jgi:hypothetical protein
MPNRLIASVMAVSASGASTYPIVAAGVPLMRENRSGAWFRPRGPPMPAAWDYGCSRRHDTKYPVKVLRLGGSMATGAYILISLVLLYAGVHLLVVVFSKVKDTLFKMFFGAISIFMIVCAVAVFFVGIQHLLP